MGGRGSSRFITILHRGGSPQFITILHRGGPESLLQYYSFERKMEGYNPFLVLNSSLDDLVESTLLPILKISRSRFLSVTFLF